MCKRRHLASFGRCSCSLCHSTQESSEEESVDDSDADEDGSDFDDEDEEEEGKDWDVRGPSRRCRVASDSSLARCRSSRKRPSARTRRRMKTATRTASARAEAAARASLPRRRRASTEMPSSARPHRARLGFRACLVDEVEYAAACVKIFKSGRQDRSTVLPAGHHIHLPPFQRRLSGCVTPPSSHDAAECQRLFPVAQG